MSSRVGLRFLQQARLARPAFRRPIGRRYQTTDAPPVDAAAKETLFRRMWNSPVGVKTVHFWAPVMKWAIVLAGVGDFFRPAEKLSLTQNLALTSTGIIWTRWCLIIKPRNVLLATVNFFLGCVGLTQVTRIMLFRASQKGSATEAIKDEAESAKDAAVGAAKKAEAKVKSSV